jgi:hypothetical protein
MPPTILAAVARLGFLAAAPLAHAVGLSALYTVPGVINAGDLGTYFLCTATDTVARTVTVDVFDAAGTAAANGNYFRPKAR